MFGKKIEKEIVVEGMHCAHCVKRVEDAIMGLNGVKKVEVDLQSGKVNITSKSELNDADINKAIDDIGFSVKA